MAATGLRLHLGCGDRHIPGFVHVDARSLPHVDVVSGLDALPAFADGAATLLYASHVLEHFSRDDCPRVLTEWYRILAPGGILRLSVPDFAQLVAVYEASGRDIETVLGPLVGRQSHAYNYHYNAFDARRLTRLLRETGFSAVRPWDWRHTEHTAVDDFSQAFYPHMDKANGTQISLNLEGVK